MNIKVCGLTQAKQVQQLDGLNIDFAGFVFHPASPRYAADKLEAEALADADLDIRKTGVFVDAGYEDIMEMVEKYGLDAVQLHGNESPELCEQLSEDVEVIKAFAISADSDIDEMVAPYDAVCDYYLFDTAAANGAGGGTGKQFDWQKVSKSKIEKPFFLSGGIGPEDAAKVKAFRHPDFFGIDLNSRFEKSPGVKDMALVLQFQQGLKK